MRFEKPSQHAVTNRRPDRQLDGSEILSAVVTDKRAFPAPNVLWH